jgi:hypothetical protein
MKIEKAVRKAIPFIGCFYGKSGSGKTYSALKLATGLANGGKICLIDTENSRASHYADEFNFDVINLQPPFHSLRYLEAIKLAENEGCSVLIIDSISHEWDGVGGCIERAEEGKTSSGKSLTGLNKWAKVKQEHRKLMQYLLQSKIHIVFCARAKDLLEQEGSGATVTITHKGIVPIQEKNFPFEMLVTFFMQDGGKVKIEKCIKGLKNSIDIPQGNFIEEKHGQIILEWINKGEAKDFRIDKLRSDGLEYAESGDLDGLKDWYNSLSKQDKEIVVQNQINVELKTIANTVIEDNNLKQPVENTNNTEQSKQSNLP